MTVIRSYLPRTHGRASASWWGVTGTVWGFAHTVLSTGGVIPAVTWGASMALMFMWSRTPLFKSANKMHGDQQVHTKTGKAVSMGKKIVLHLAGSLATVALFNSVGVSALSL